jgi:hypothetical protein
MGGPGKLEYYITLVWKGLPVTNGLAYRSPFVSYEENELLLRQPLIATQSLADWVLRENTICVSGKGERS